MEHATYRYRLRVKPSQARELQAVFDNNRFVWNTALGRWSDLWKYEHVSLSEFDMMKELTDWRSRFDWLAATPCTTQQQTIRRLYSAIRRFYDKNTPHRHPRFKKKGMVSSARWTTHAFAVADNRLLLARAGNGHTKRLSLRLVLSRQFPSRPTSVTVQRDASGHWWARFDVFVKPENIGATGVTTGLDLGLHMYATTEFPDADVPNPRFARQAAKALARSQRNMARKQKGSKNRTKARWQTARVHAKVASQRSDFVHKEARKLARRFDVIGVEDLRIRNMLANRKLARSISDAGWADFLAVLDWHARKCSHKVVRLNSRNTTQTCSACGVKAKRHVGLADRIFSCEECGLIEDRDRNAARNLNPNRQGKTGAGVDGSKTAVPAGTTAA